MHIFFTEFRISLEVKDFRAAFLHLAEAEGCDFKIRRPVIMSSGLEIIFLTTQTFQYYNILNKLTLFSVCILC
jgi:hypothetical protein